MTPHFPSRNGLFHTFNEYFEKEFAFEYSEFLYPTHGWGWDAELMATNSRTFDLLLKGFENEINQTIFGGNPIIINALFTDLKERRKSLFPNRETFRNKLNAWNEETTDKKFDLRAEEAYFNFLCDKGQQCAEILDRYIPSYDKGDYTQKDEKLPWWRKPKRLIATISAGIIGLATVLGSIKSIRENVIDFFTTETPKTEFSTPKTLSSEEFPFGDPTDNTCDYVLRIEDFKANVDISNPNNIKSTVEYNFHETLSQKCPEQETKIKANVYFSDKQKSWIKDNQIHIEYISHTSDPKCTFTFDGTKLEDKIIGRFFWVRNTMDIKIRFVVYLVTELS